MCVCVWARVVGGPCVSQRFIGVFAASKYFSRHIVNTSPARVTNGGGGDPIFYTAAGRARVVEALRRRRGDYSSNSKIDRRTTRISFRATVTSRGIIIKLHARPCRVTFSGDTRYTAAGNSKLNYRTKGPHGPGVPVGTTRVF